VKRGLAFAASSIRWRSAAWTILLDWMFRSRRPASALWMTRAIPLAFRRAAACAVAASISNSDSNCSSAPSARLCKWHFDSGRLLAAQPALGGLGRHCDTCSLGESLLHGLQAMRSLKFCRAEAFVSVEPMSTLLPKADIRTTLHRGRKLNFKISRS